MTKPLVSVVVITYNSACTVIETLDSIYTQSYQNIQLIISDDGSKDNTVNLCQSWIEQNKSRFCEVKLITVEKNTGICSNLNRAKKYAKGEWCKDIAGDDILLPRCIEDNMNFIKDNPQARIVFSYPKVYINEFKEDNLINRLPYPEGFFSLDAHHQLKKIANGNFLYAPTKFYHKELVKLIDYDERYYFEDWLFYIKVLQKGYRFYLLEKETVGYRKSSASMQVPQSGQIFNYKMQESTYRIKRDFCFKYLPLHSRIRTLIKYSVVRHYELNNKNNVRYLESYNKVLSVLGKLRLI